MGLFISYCGFDCKYTYLLYAISSTDENIIGRLFPKEWGCKKSRFYPQAFHQLSQNSTRNTPFLPHSRRANLQ